MFLAASDQGSSRLHNQGYIGRSVTRQGHHLTQQGYKVQECVHNDITNELLNMVTRRSIPDLNGSSEAPLSTLTKRQLQLVPTVHA
ncbi:hypothetical protein E2C01_002394 [Portunus trituberculatus]|uniref:Uncharacterized protein n=1 Tax=Portunus trituberculatus TaxID=210409 RepID=A0A5B7CN53_PORTR|nr:hypothetical protein [Portunus trituberculatus]